MNLTSHAPSLSLALGALACLATPVVAQEHEDFDSYAANSQVVGQGGWEEWGAGAGALVSSAQALSLPNSIDIKGATDLVRRYSGYTSGRWVYRAKQYIPTGATGKGYFILLSSYGVTNVWAVQVAFNTATNMVEADAGGAAAGAKTAIVYDKWVDIDVLIDLDADWVQFRYNGVLLDDAAVADHPTLGGGWAWTKGPTGTSNGPRNIGAVDLFANNGSSVYYDEISLEAATAWSDTIDTYAANSQIVGQGGWEEWGPGAGAMVSNTRAYGPGNSINITGPSDLVHRYSGYTSGVWEYRAKQYVPTGLSAESYFILLSSYPTNNVWSVQLRFNPTSGNVLADAGRSGSQASTKIVYDKWIDIQVIIDLDADWVQVYYDNVLLDDPLLADHPTLGGGYAWTKGVFGTNNGPKNIAAVDLYANNASPVYYDDLSLRPAKKGVRNYRDASQGSRGLPRIYALDDAVAPSTTFGFGCRNAPASKPGVFALSTAAFPQGQPLLGISILVNPTPPSVIVPITTDVNGGNSFVARLRPQHAGVTVYAQYIFLDTTPNMLSATDGLQVRIQ